MGVFCMISLANHSKWFHKTQTSHAAQHLDLFWGGFGGGVLCVRRLQYHWQEEKVVLIRPITCMEASGFDASSGLSTRDLDADKVNFKLLLDVCVCVCVLLMERM